MIALAPLPSWLLVCAVAVACIWAAPYVAAWLVPSGPHRPEDEGRNRPSAHDDDEDLTGGAPW